MAAPGRKPISINIRTVERLASRGLTQEQICDAMGIAKSTYFAHKARNQELMDAIRRGQAKGASDVANFLYQQAKKGNAAAAIFFMKNRAGWKDKCDIEQDVKLPQPLVIQLPAQEAKSSSKGKEK